VRLFAAIELTDEVREALTEVQSALGKTTEGVRWVRVEQLHLTVKFLGEVPDVEVAGVCETVQRAAAAAQALADERALVLHLAGIAREVCPEAGRLTGLVCPWFRLTLVQQISTRHRPLRRETVQHRGF